MVTRGPPRTQLIKDTLLLTEGGMTTDGSFVQQESIVQLIGWVERKSAVELSSYAEGRGLAGDLFIEKVERK
jgi:hypothetical protein